MPKFRNSEPYYGNGIKEMDWVKTKHQQPEGMNRPPLIPPGEREYRELMLMCQYQ
jgi:hypothetical protein